MISLGKWINHLLSIRPLYFHLLHVPNAAESAGSGDVLVSGILMIHQAVEAKVVKESWVSLCHSCQLFWIQLRRKH